MEYDNILENHKTHRQQPIDRKLRKLGNQLFKEGKWEPKPVRDSVTNATIKGNIKGVTISNISLTENCKSDKRYNKAGYVYTVKDMFHEYRHTEQTAEWNNIPHPGTESDLDVKLMTDITRRKLVSFYFPIVYAGNYANDPSEVDAEIYGIEQTIEYFKSDRIVSEKDAKKILWEFMVAEDYFSKKIFEGYNPETIEDVLTILKEHRENAANILYDLNADVPPELQDTMGGEYDMTDKFKNDPKFEKYREALKNCKTGIEQDKILMQAILLEYPDVNIHSKRINKEFSDCLVQRDDMHLSKEDVIEPDMVNFSVSPERSSEEESETANYLSPEEMAEFTDSLSSMPDNNLKL